MNNGVGVVLFAVAVAVIVAAAATAAQAGPKELIRTAAVIVGAVVVLVACRSACEPFR